MNAKYSIALKKVIVTIYERRSFIQNASLDIFGGKFGRLLQPLAVENQIFLH